MNIKIVPKRTVLTLVLLILPLYFSFPQLTIDIKTLIAKSDLIYNKPVSRSEEGMPVGNGRMGTLVWTTPSSLNFQINRADVFGNSSASNNFFERNTDYCSGAGFVDIDFLTWGDDVFTPPGFRQHLSCYDGMVTTEGKDLVTRTMVWNEKDVMAVNITDHRDSPQAVIINLRMLRDTVIRRGNHTATSRLKTINNRIILTQEFTEDDFFSGSAVVIGISGRECMVRKSGNNEIKLVVKPGNGTFTVFIAGSASFNRDEEIILSAMKNLDAAVNEGYDRIVETNRDWWKDFWDRSYVNLHSSDGEADLITKNYNYFFYVMASSSRGSLPPKFNGMIWTTGGDARKWGNMYWGANQSCMYNGLFPANRMELLEPMFRMYTGMAASLETAARQQWGSKGIYIPETVGFDGLPELPEDIASEMQVLYLNKKPWSQRSGKFVEYAATRPPFLSRWNWKQDTGWKEGKWHFTDKGTGAFGHVTHIFSRGAKIAYQYWQRYEYTGDISWLKESAYPMIRGIAEFYRNFPGLRKEADGKYHIYYVNDNESVRGGHNTVEEISSMMGILPVAIRASEILKTDSDLRTLWKELQQNLSPLPLNSDYPETYKHGTPVTFVRSLPPVIQGNGSGRPDQNTMPVWFFDLCNPVAGNTELVKIANVTFDSYFPKGISSESPVYVLSKLAVTGTIMGRKDATRYLIPNQIRTAEIETMANRMTLREGYQTTGVQNLGRMVDALHYALVNSSPPGPGLEPVIQLFPAWPDDWDAEFKLLCRGNFIVTSSFSGGKVISLGILSQNGGSCKIVNPWTDKKIALNRNGKEAGTISGNILIFNTKPNEKIILTDNISK